MKRCKRCKELKTMDRFYKHRSTRDKLHPTCIDCAAEDYQRNKESRKARARINAPAWRAKNKEKIKTWHADNYRRNRDTILPMTKIWAAANKARKSSNNSAWKRANLDKIRSYNHARRAAKVEAGGSHTAAEIKTLLIAQDHLCANPYCRADLRSVKRHLDHKTPLVRCGSNGIDNLQWLCAPCNLSKATLNQGEWLALQRMRTAA